MAWKVGADYVLDGNSTHYLNGQGQFTTPAGTSGSFGAYSYIVRKNGADWEGLDRNGTLVYGGAADVGGINGASCDAVLQACVNANDVSIMVTHDLDAALLTIPYNNVSIISVPPAEIAGDTWDTPRITRVLVSNAAAAVKNTIIRGLNIRELDLYANGNNNNIDNIILRECQLRNTATAGQQGVLIRSAGTGYVYFLKFYDCKFNDYADQSALNQGAIFVESTSDSNGQMNFNNCEYKPRADNTVFFCIKGRIIQTVLDNVNYINIAKTGIKFLRLMDGGKLTDMRIMKSLFEMHIACTIFQIDDGAADSQLLHVDFSHNTFSLTNAETVNFCQNNTGDGDWAHAIADNNGICAFDNYIKVNKASFDDSHVAASAHWHYNIASIDWTA